MIRRRIQRVELQRNVPDVDNVVIRPGRDEHREAWADRRGNAVEDRIARAFLHAKDKRILEECQATVFTAGDALEGLESIESHRPDVLISDIGMPEIDGFEFLRRVRALGQEHGGEVPAIALTAFARPQDRIQALRAGFTVHLAKPVEAPELLAVVAGAARRPR